MSVHHRRAFLTATTALAGAAGWVGRATADEPKEPQKLGKTPHTKFAVNLEIWWKNLPMEQRLEKVAEYGYPGVEFWPYENKPLKVMSRMCEKLGIEICQFTAWGFTPGMNDPKNLAAFLKKVEEACQVAKAINCKMMTVVGGNDQKGMTQAEMHANIIEALKRAAPIAEKHQVVLILEPMNIRVDHKGHCLYGSEAGVRICRAVGSPFVKLNWDLYHCHISEGDLCGHLKEGFDQLGYVQIADHPGRKEPGTGEIHYPRVLKELHRLGYRGFVGLELWPSKDEHTAAQAVYRADQWQ
jgi:hydroxypyruvate isomerase